MGADDVVGGGGGAGGRGDQVGNAPALVVVGLFGDLQPGVLEDLRDVALGPREAVAAERRARADPDGQHLDVLAQGLLEPGFDFPHGAVLLRRVRHLKPRGW